MFYSYSLTLQFLKYKWENQNLILPGSFVLVLSAILLKEAIETLRNLSNIHIFNEILLYSEKIKIKKCISISVEICFTETQIRSRIKENYI